jgi:histone deacetylase 6
MESNQYHSVYLTSDSLMEAEKASQSFCYLVSRVVLGDVNNGFAIIRPPGHHAQSGMAGGYCVINHVAVAASYALTNLGLSKILIVDWDVHHGNGTQEIFFDNPNVLYISLHRWEGGNFFPFSANAGPTHIGKGRGKGYNANVGWSRKGMGDAEYLAAWTRLVLPLAREFDPDLVLVSAGFDAAQGDMGDCNVAPQCFGQMTRMLMTLAKGRVVCTLEGGYKRSILSKCVLSVLHALTGMPDEANKDEHNCPLGPNHEASVCGWWDEIDDSAARSIEATIGALRPYWKCLQSMSQPSG